MTTRTRRDRIRVQRVVSLLSVALVLAAPARGQDRSGEPDQALAGARIIVFPFRNLSDDIDTGWIGDGIAAVLVADLLATAGARVIGRDGIAAARTGLGLPDAGALSRADVLAIGRQAGARWLLRGYYQRFGAHILVTARVVDCETGEIVRTARVEGLLEELFALQDLILPGLGWTDTAPTATARTTGDETAVASDVNAWREPALESAPEGPPAATASETDLYAAARARARAMPLSSSGDEEDSRSLFWDVAGDLGRFFTKRETYAILGLGLAGSLGVKPYDQNIRHSRFTVRSPRHEGTGLDTLFEPGHVLGSANLQVGVAFATYGMGRWVGTPRVAELGRDLVRAQLLTAIVTRFVKHTVRRPRPGGNSLTSFPSGHAAATFASATVLHRHYGWRVGIPAFGVASYVAVSRVGGNQHFLSDVVFGAAVGLSAGRTVTFDWGATRLEVSPLAVSRGAGVQVSVFKTPLHSVSHRDDSAGSRRSREVCVPQRAPRFTPCQEAT